MSRRIFSFILAIFFVLNSSVQPAYAFAPPLILGGAAVATPTGSYLGLSLLSGLLGLTGMFLSLKDNGNNEIAIPLSPHFPEPPVPVAPATATPIQSNAGTGTGTGPATGSCRVYYNGNSYMSVQAACNAYINNPSVIAAHGYTPLIVSVSGDPLPQTCSPSAFAGICRLRPPYDWTIEDVSLYTTIAPTLTCPKGYSIDGETCKLTNARQAIDDHRCDLLFSNGQFATADDLNCTETTDGSKLQPLLRGGKVIAYGKNGSGQPLVFTVSPSVTIGNREWVTVQQQTQIQTPTQTQVETVVLQVDPDSGSIVSVQTTTNPGSIQSPSDTTLPTTNSLTSPSTTPTVSVNPSQPTDLRTCGLSGSSPCIVDDSGFRTLQTNDRLSDISTVEDQRRTDLQNSKDSKPQIDFDWLPSLLPGSSVVCKPIPLNIIISHGFLSGISVTENLDICDKLEIVRQILGYLLFLSTVIYVWRVFSNSNKGE